MKAYLTLIKKALKENLVISVFDGEEWAVKKSNKYTDIKDAIESVEEAQIIVRNLQGDKIGWALIIPDLEPDETIADCSHNPKMCELCDFEYTN